MAVVKINELFISLDSEQSYYELDLIAADVDISFSGIDTTLQRKIIFIGLPVNGKINNIRLSELRKTDVKGNNVLALLYKLILKTYDFDYFFVSTAGLDPMGVSFLKELPSAFEHLNKKVFVIGAKPHTYELKIFIDQ